MSFLKLSKSDVGYHIFVSNIADKKNRKGDGKVLKTKRNVKIGSIESFVKKQYGNATKVKVKKKEKYYKYIKYTYDSMDISSWKTYLEYNLKKFYVRN